MTSLEKAINLGYLFLTLKPKKYICTTFFYMYWYVSIYSEEFFLPQYMYPKLSPFNGYHWCPLGKLSHLGLEQLMDDLVNFYKDTLWQSSNNLRRPGKGVNPFVSKTKSHKRLVIACYLVRYYDTVIRPLTAGIMQCNPIISNFRE